MEQAARITWAERWVFPGLVTAMVVGNQGWMIGPFLGGQMISWAVDRAAVMILFRFSRGQAWPLLIAFGIIVARALGSGADGDALADAAYLWLLNTLFCLAGAVMAYRFFPLVRRQVRLLCLFSVLIMVLQVSGTWEWPQLLATENAGAPKTPKKTLFVPVEQLQYQTIQARPSGPLHSNNFLSLIVLFGLALQHGDKSRRRLNRWDVAVAAMSVLSMAKIVFLCTALMTLWLILLGTREQRARAFAFAFTWVAIFASYRFFFPGLFDAQMNVYHIGYSFYIRINDFVDRLGPDHPIARLLAPYLVGTPRLVADTGETGFSGYTQALRLLPLVVAVLILGWPTIVRAVRRFHRRVSGANSVPALAGIIVLVYPGAVPFLKAQIFWFIAGFAVMPVVVMILGRTERRPPIPRALPQQPSPAV